MADRFVLVPRSGVRASNPAEAAALLQLPAARSTEAFQTGELLAAPGRPIVVIDSINENGAKLVEMDPVAAAAANAPDSPVRALPEVIYSLPEPLTYSPAAASLAAAPGGPTTSFTVLCTDSSTGAALPGCKVVAFDNFATRSGASGVTDAAGKVQLKLAGGLIDRLYVYSKSTHWGAFRASAPIVASATVAVAIDRISLAYTDAVRAYYGTSHFTAATGVTVGVIDTGVGPHTNLNLISGRNTVTGEPLSQFGDWFGHGTHVAGLIGSNGAPPAGLRGVAPGAQIRAYRVFGQGGGGATNYAILKAMIFAAADGCDIINLSLGGGPYDQIVEEAIADARNQGMLVVIAAGNDGRKPVSYPAAYLGATAISALGRIGTYPAGSLSDGDVMRPPNSTVDPREFIAGFSNVGPQIAVTAPGVGVLSTLPNNDHGAMSGTSMAAPVAVGAAVCLLSRNPGIFGMPRNNLRAVAIERLLQTNCASRGFGSTFEGFGMPDPTKV